MFCPKCGSILLPKKEGSKTVTKCKCGYSSNSQAETKFSESAKKEIDQRSSAAVESEIETLPLTDTECPKCKHKKAFFWEVQTRAADEAPTKFMKCEKCKHIWRDYN